MAEARVLAVLLGALVLIGCPTVDDDDVGDDDVTECVPQDEIPYDGVDQDCDGFDLTDADGDGHDAAEVDGDDCDDTDPDSYPGAEEIPYDGVDQDCDGADLTDVDGDGYDAEEVGGDDCNDDDPATHPDAEEICDGLDNNCNDGMPHTEDDDDGDGWMPCEGDCDDADDTVHPGAADVCDGVLDNDCDGVVDPSESDDDLDGYSDCDGDCDDSDALTYPSASEDHNDGIDNDCDGRIDEYHVCWDGSGEFVTVQEGIDGTPDGGAIEICPGTYQEDLSIDDRQLTIAGGGVAPEDVALIGTGTADVVSVVSITGESTEAHIRWLTVQSGGNSVKAVSIGDSTAVEISEVAFCGGAEGFISYFNIGGGDSIAINRCWFCVQSCPGCYPVLINEYNSAGSIAFSCNVVDFTLQVAAHFGSENDAVGSWSVNNNLFSEGNLSFSRHAGDEPRTTESSRRNSESQFPPAIVTSRG